MKQLLNSLTNNSGKKLLLALVAVVLVLTCGFVWTCKEQVTIDDNGKITQVNAYNYGGNIPSAMQHAGIVLGKYDEYRITSQSMFTGKRVMIYRAVPVMVTYQGKTVQIMCGKPTVKELAQTFRPDGQVKVSIPESTRPVAGMNIVVTAVDEKTVEKVRPVKFETVNVPNDKMEKGQTSIIEAGKLGSEKVTVKDTYEDGKLVNETTISSTQISAPVNEKISVGTREIVETSRGAERFRTVMTMTATAYTEADGPGGGYTATGMRARHGVIAVDPNVIPLGTRVFVEGYGLAVAGDTGGAIQGNIIDLCMDQHYEAINFGRRTVKVYILE